MFFKVTNLDPSIEQRDMRHVITQLFIDYVAVTSVSVYRLDSGGSLGALVRVPGHQEAQLDVPQQKRKVGS